MMQKYKKNPVTATAAMGFFVDQCDGLGDDVGDDENAKEPLVKVSGNPFLPMGYRENIDLHTFTVL